MDLAEQVASGLAVKEVKKVGIYIYINIIKLSRAIFAVKFNSNAKYSQ